MRNQSEHLRSGKRWMSNLARQGVAKAADNGGERALSAVDWRNLGISSIANMAGS